jgi:hypothetical protein
VDTYITVSAKHIDETSKTIDTAEVEISKASGDLINIGDEVSIGYTSGSWVTAFAGYVTNKQIYGTCNLTISSYGSIINRVIATEIYRDKSPEYIVEDLIDKYTDLTYASTATSGVTLTKFVVNKQTVEYAISQLLKLLDWQIMSDNDKNFYFESPGEDYSSDPECVPSKPRSKNERVITHEMMVSPNPGNGLFDFSWHEDVQIDQIFVYDINGRLIIKKDIKSGQNQISVDIINQVPGVYIWEAKAGNEVKQKGKIIFKSRQIEP